MTPERREEIDKAIAWWRQQENWRINGFDIIYNDPLFPMPKKKSACPNCSCPNCACNPQSS